MKKLEDMKKEYENIKASDELKQKAHQIFKEENKKSFSFKKFATIAAGVAVVFTVSVNVSPKVAYAMSEIPGLNYVIRVLTLDKYEVEENGYELNVTTPKIEGLLDKELEAKLNSEFKENANSVIKAFEEDMKALKEEFGDETVHMGLDFNYMVKTDNDNYLALDVYILNTAGSSSTKHSFYTINKQTGELLTLNGLFKDGADYVSVLSDYIKTEMARLNNEEGGMFWVDDDEFTEGFKGIKKDQNFYINEEGNLVICFDKYDVAAGAQGSPEFVIPNEIIKDIVK